MKANRSEWLTNQQLSRGRNQFYTNPYNKKDNVKDNGGGLGIIVFIICVVLFAEPIVNTILNFIGV